jgi:hypothetical protein
MDFAGSKTDWRTSSASTTAAYCADDAFSKVELKYMSDDQDNAKPDDFAVRVHEGTPESDSADPPQLEREAAS